MSFWLPLISSNTDIPCILVGNKIDLPKSSPNLEEICKDITYKYPQCQIAIETTAKSYASIDKIFQIAEQSVLFPTSKLQNPITYELTEEFIMALKLIFRLCDQDGDMRLNNEELERFNSEVFQNPLSTRDIEKLKNLIKEACIDGVDNIGVTLPGFIAINKIFIKKLKSNSSWKMLEYFGFDSNLERKSSTNYNEISELRSKITQIHEFVKETTTQEIKRVTDLYQINAGVAEEVGLFHVIRSLVGDRVREFNRYTRSSFISSKNRISLMINY